MENNLPNQENLIKGQLHDSVTPKKTFFAIKLIFIGILIILLAVIGTTFYLIKSFQIKKNATPVTKSEHMMPPGKIYFDNTELDVSPNETNSVNIEVNSGSNQVGKVVLSIKYNPYFFTKIKIEQIKDPNSALSQALIPDAAIENDEKNGYLRMSLTAPKGMQGLKGKGIIAKLTFTRSAANVAIPSSEISFHNLTSLSTGTGDQIPVQSNVLTTTFSAR